MNPKENVSSTSWDPNQEALRWKDPEILWDIRMLVVAKIRLNCSKILPSVKCAQISKLL